MTLSLDLLVQKMVVRLWCILGKLFNLDKWTKTRAWTSSLKTWKTWKMPKMLSKHQPNPQETKGCHIFILWIGWLRLQISNSEDLSNQDIIRADLKALIRGLTQRWSILIITLSSLLREFLVLSLKRNSLKSQKKQKLRKRNKKQKKKQS